jgi:hypothetical protein
MNVCTTKLRAATAREPASERRAACCSRATSAAPLRPSLARSSGWSAPHLSDGAGTRRVSRLPLVERYRLQMPTSNLQAQRVRLASDWEEAPCQITVTTVILRSSRV